jgi:hypothetical protein
MKNILNSIRPQVAIPFWGIIGGLALMFIAGLEQNAIAVIPIFGLTLMSFILTIKLKTPEKMFSDLYKTTFVTFTIMTVIDYFYIINVVNPAMLTVPLLGHLWRILLMLVIGALVSLALAYIASIIKKRASIIST